MKNARFGSVFLFVALTGITLPSPSFAGIASSERFELGEETPAPRAGAESVHRPNLNETDGYDSAAHEARYSREKINSKKRKSLQPGRRHNL